MLAPILAASLTLADLRSQTSIAAVRIAPDAKHVAYIARRADWVKDRYDARLVLVDTARGAARTLVSQRRGLTDVQWAPDNGALAFLATEPQPEPAKPGAKARKPKPQLFVLPLGGGDAVQVTDAPEGVTGFAWRPDARGFAYTAPAPSPDQSRIDAHDDWFVVGDVAWNASAAAQPDHLWTIDRDGTHARRVTSGDWSASDPVWSSDGRTVYALRGSAEPGHWRARALVAIDAARGTMRTLRAAGAGSSGALAADGRGLWYVAENPAAFAQSDLYRRAPDGTTRDVTARFDREILDARPVPGGADAVVADGVRQRIVRFADDARATPLDLGDVVTVASLSAAHDGTLAFAGSTATSPADVYVLAPGARAPRRLSTLNRALTARVVAPSREVTWRTRDGLMADGVLTVPTGCTAQHRCPLVLDIHGGPTAASTLAWSSLPQLMAARGWIVFQPNYRGSDNLGARFNMSTVPGITSVPGDDIVRGVDAVQRLGMVDPARIGVSGWSEGGLLTSWLIGHDHRWKAAMTGAGVHDWVGYANLTDARDFSPSFLGRTPWLDARDAAFYAQESPLTFASAVKTPTLILTDTGDQRVPTPVSYEYAHALRAAGAPVEMMVIPVDGHFPSDPLHREEVNRLWIEWFAKHL